MNRYTKQLLGLMFFVGVSFALPVSANEFFLATEDLTPEAFPAAAERVRTDMADQRGPYSRLSTAEVERVDRLLDRLEAALADDSPSAGTRVRRYQASINKVLTAAVPTSNTTEYLCRKEKLVGSHRRATRCYDRQELDETSRELQHRLLMKNEGRFGD